VKRGEIWTVSGTGYAGKPRPAVIVQSDAFDATASITVCPVTSERPDAAFARIKVEPNERNGLRFDSHLMVDKITTVRKQKLGRRVGRLAPSEVRSLNQAIMVFLGLA
jgi:mRNA interferase MazF